MSPKSLLVDDEVTKGDVPEGGVLRGDSAMAGDGVGTTSFGLAVGGVGPLRTKRVGAGVVGRLGPGIRLSGLGVDTLDDSPAIMHGAVTPWPHLIPLSIIKDEQQSEDPSVPGIFPHPVPPHCWLHTSAQHTF